MVDCNIITFDFMVGDDVVIDGDPCMTGRVTGLFFEGVDSDRRRTYRVEWFSNGSKHEAFFDSFRLRLKE